MSDKKKSCSTPLCTIDTRSRLCPILVCSSPTSKSRRPIDSTSSKTLVVSSLAMLSIGLTRGARVVAVLYHSLLLQLNRFLGALMENLWYQPPFRSTLLAGMSSPGSIFICPELGLGWFFFPFLPGCCHPLTCGCALALCGVCCGTSFVFGLRGD